VRVVSWATLCEIVGALPGTELDTGTEHPAWRVSGKVLVRRNPRLRVPGEDEIRRDRGELVAIRTDFEEREALMRMDPDTFFITPHWRTSPSILVWLETVDPVLLGELVVDAWRGRAPKRVVREWRRGGHEGR
jgi:hypothetical protein